MFDEEGAAVMISDLDSQANQGTGIVEILPRGSRAWFRNRTTLLPARRPCLKLALHGFPLELTEDEHLFPQVVHDLGQDAGRSWN